MTLFSKQKPTKRIDIGEAWVELQFLSKGVKDEISSRLSSMFEGVDSETLNKMNSENKDDIPTSMIGALSKVQEVEYYKLASAIKAWSDHNTLVSVEAVKELDEEVFNKISTAVNEMNELSKGDQKN